MEQNFKMWEQANVCMIDTYIDNLIYDKVDNEEMLVFSIKDAKSIGYLSMRKKWNKVHLIQKNIEWIIDMNVNTKNTKFMKKSKVACFKH